MPIEVLPHILLHDQKQKISYTPIGRRVDLLPDTPVYDQTEHSAALERAYHESIQAFEEQYVLFDIDPNNIDKGVAVEYKFRSDAVVDITKLEDLRSNIELLNVKFDESGVPESAIIYIPPTKEKILSNQIKSYGDRSKNTSSGPRNFKKYDKTESFTPATIEKLWIDREPLPSNRDRHFNWEVWLRTGKYDYFKAEAENRDLSVSSHKLVFPEREICSVRCSLNNLHELFLITKAITGYRYLPTLADFFDALSPREQKDWCDDLIPRVDYDQATETSVCILDTGIFDQHRLLNDYIARGGIDSVDPSWGSDDHDGHGTSMSGLALFGDLTKVLETADPIELKHCLESVKVFPPQGQNEDEHIGYITSQAVSLAEINRPDLKRVFCLAWSMEHPDNKKGETVTAGRPTPLSAQLDQLAFGVEEFDTWTINDEKKRLLIVSAGNIREEYPPSEYSDINDLNEIEDPAQAWNLLTVGAYTEKMFTNDPDYNDWSPVAENGDISPKSRTSVLWKDSQWPTKPDVMLEGGNYLKDPNGNAMLPHPDTCLLTTDSQRIFGLSHDTSAATAQASQLAAELMAKYPELWPESVRGLMVHSAEWTGSMNIPLKYKLDKIRQLRRYGYGVPQRQYILNSFSNRPCIIIQDYLKPFVESAAASSSSIVFNDMNYYELPWPIEQLMEIYDKSVQLRVTLSYFIEPSPSERPPKTKYGYASHELRFKLNRPNETLDSFLTRINNELRVDEFSNESQENLDITERDAQDKWLLGPQSRDRGSMISDIWQGTGAELSRQNLLAVVPQGGWWKFRKSFPDSDRGRFNEHVRYSLILSLITEEEIDLYTPIVTEAGIEITT